MTSLPADAAGLLDEAAYRLGVAMSDEQRGQLLAYAALLLRWNVTYNLTALREPRQVLTHHVVDCLAAVPPLQRWLDGRSARLLDVGSGGGLPGVVLAVSMPAIDVTCVDTVGKKAAFVRQVAAELRLPNLRAEHARVERLSGRWDVVTSRAFASLGDFTEWTERALAVDGAWLAMKGRRPDEELAALPPTVEVFHVEPLTVPYVDADRCLVWMRRRAAAADASN